MTDIQLLEPSRILQQAPGYHVFLSREGECPDGARPPDGLQTVTEGFMKLVGRHALSVRARPYHIASWRRK